ncbi:MAG: alpha/beta fold hydrolase, partial [Acidobacteria bacterium]|nr:alpha/beta fold hydrolase [Acidobacteriota bacterium]
HGVYPPVVEEIFREFYLGSALTGLWNLMKRSTARAFGPDAQRFGGTAVLDELGQAWRAGHRPRVILVGHSTGAIAICHWLAHAQAWLPPDARFDVVLLAPACTCGLLARTIDDHGARIGGLRSFGMCDDLERTDQLVPGLYPRSLLYFVSGVLEDTADEPLVGMARHVSGRPPFDAAMPEVSTVASFMASRPGGLVWSPAVDEPGRASLATRHEDFDDDAVTLASLASVITSGF